MHPIAWIATLLVVFAGFGAASFIWLAMNSADDDLRSFMGWDGMHFEES